MNDDCTAADGGGGEGTTVRCTTAVEGKSEGIGGDDVGTVGEGDVADVGGGVKGGAATVVELRGAAECSVEGGKKESKKESSIPGIQPRPSASR